MRKLHEEIPPEELSPEELSPEDLTIPHNKMPLICQGHLC